MFLSGIVERCSGFPDNLRVRPRLLFRRPPRDVALPLLNDAGAALTRGFSFTTGTTHKGNGNVGNALDPPVVG